MAIAAIACLLATSVVVAMPATAQSTSEDEPNDDRESATRIDPGASVDGDVLEEGDVDWFVLDVEAGETINVTLTAGSAGKTEVTFYREDDRLRRTFVEGETKSIGTTAQTTGEYHVMVGPGSGEANGGEYTLTVETYPTDGFEPDSQDDPGAIDPDTQVDGFVSIGDEDWFVFEPEAGETINVTASAGERGETAVALRTDDGGIARKFLEGETKSIGTTVQTGGPFYLLLSPASGENRGDQYSVTVETYRTDDFEPDSQEDPVALSPNATVDGFVSIGDEDWFAFEADAGDTINVTASAGERGETAVALRTDDGGIARKFLEGETKSIGTTVHTARTYYVRVSPASGENRGDQYTVNVDTYRTDEFEPDTQDTAMELTPNATQSGFVSIGDDDWFVFEAVDGAVYNVSLTAGDRGETEFEVRGPGGHIDRAFVEGGSKSRVITANGSSAHYVRVGPASGHNRGDEYTLEITTNATISPEEDGDSAAGDVDSGDESSDGNGSSSAVSQGVIGAGFLLVVLVLLVVVYLRRNRE